MDQGHAGYLQNLNSVIPGTDGTYRPLEDEPLNDEPFNVIDAIPLTEDSNASVPQLAPVTGYEAFAVSTGETELFSKLDAERDKTDYEILNERIDELTRILHGHTQALNYVSHGMKYLVEMLGSVAQMAQNMPGMGGMVAKMMGMGGKNNGR